MIEHGSIACVVSQRSSLDSAPRRRSGEAARELGKKSVFDSDFQRAVLENSPTSGQDSGREDAGSHCISCDARSSSVPVFRSLKRCRLLVDFPVLETDLPQIVVVFARTTRRRKPGESLSQKASFEGSLSVLCPIPCVLCLAVSYTHLTLPTILRV